MIHLPSVIATISQFSAHNHLYLRARGERFSQISTTYRLRALRTLRANESFELHFGAQVHNRLARAESLDCHSPMPPHPLHSCQCLEASPLTVIGRTDCRRRPTKLWAFFGKISRLSSLPPPNWRSSDIFTSEIAGGTSFYITWHQSDLIVCSARVRCHMLLEMARRASSPRRNDEHSTIS